MSKRLDIAYTTLIAELLERALDAQFDMEFDEAGAFIKVTAKGRDYWYYKPSLRNGRVDKRQYVGPAEDEQISKRVENFRTLKNNFQARRKIVSTLVREACLFSPEQRVGDLVEAFWKAGVFRLRACLIGTVAYQTYGAVLGYRLGGTAMQTGDIDLAQFHSISVAVEDSIPPVLDVLQAVDESFHAVPALNDNLGATRFEGKGGLRVEFLTPNRGGDEFAGKPARMPSLGGAAAEPLRFLDFLIHEPVRTVMLHKGGIPVLVPDPCRYAVHKLIVSARRKPGSGKELKDLGQADELVKALTETGRRDDLFAAFEEALARGHAWREAIETSLTRMKAVNLSITPEIFGAT
ncbi:GSU2403 family nucleotidyltransferase fold protein [Arvimicrobium flavum]|uniref:nucleotidyltransferase family protein n=1 Tax=Arvimicrobium flavum TaxID=3393320 RepID=UPI00237A6855|nr:GSU2403 family nucleotidyltransferase fold protein [Mesorhizobium shangrilense]